MYGAKSNAGFRQRDSCGMTCIEWGRHGQAILLLKVSGDIQGSWPSFRSLAGPQINLARDQEPHFSLRSFYGIACSSYLGEKSDRTLQNETTKSR